LIEGLLRSTAVYRHATPPILVKGIAGPVGAGHWRRAAILLAAILLLPACSRAPEELSRTAVAVVEGDTLSVDALSSWLVLGQPLPLTEEVADGLTRHWLEMAALRALGTSRLRDPAVVDAATWPARRAAVLAAALADVLGPAPEPTPAEVEAAYEGDRFRLAARILRRASPEAHPEERERQRQAAFDIRRSLTRGTGWQEAVARSEDEASRARAGLLGLVRPGELPPGLDRVVFQLRPGEISTVLETQEGFQVVYRPRLDDVRDIFRDELRVALQEDRRVRFVDSLAASRGLSVPPDAARRIADLAGDTETARGEVLASWEGGELPDTAALRYLTTLDPLERRRLSRGSASAARALLLEMARQELVWAVLGDPPEQRTPTAESAEVRGVTDDWLALVDQVDAVLGTSSTDALDEYMRAVVARRRDPLPIPPAAMEVARREVEPLAVDSAGVAAAVARARRLVAAGEDPS
jgi:ketosteroid isomerase-like protein